MRVLYLVTKSERGGAQVHVLDLIRTLGNRIDPVVACGDDGFLLDECRRLGVETHVIPELVHPVRPVEDFKAVLAVSSLIRRCGADLIHGHTGKAGLVARLAGLLTQTPALYTVHAWTFVGTGRITASVATWIERAVRFAKGTVIEVCHSNFQMARRKRVVSPRRHLTIWNGMPDTNHRANGRTPNRAIRIFMAARFVALKDHATLLHALEGLEQENWQMIFAGDGPNRPRMEQLASDLGIRSRVRFLGETDEVESLLAASDVFVLSSRTESLPLSIIEAMRAGLPVVATNVGGVSELVTDGVNGYVVPTGDAGALRESLRSLLASPEKRARMGHLSRQRFERDFTIEVMAGAVLSLYREHRQAPLDRSFVFHPSGTAI